VVENPNSDHGEGRADLATLSQVADVASFSRTGTPPALFVMSGKTAGTDTKTGANEMTRTLDFRQIAVSLSGAFVAAMLFVSAAVGPLHIA
jgi:hypothetical protein